MTTATLVSSGCQRGRSRAPKGYALLDEAARAGSVLAHFASEWTGPATAFSPFPSGGFLPPSRWLLAGGLDGGGIALGLS